MDVRVRVYMNNVITSIIIIMFCVCTGDTMMQLVKYLLKTLCVDMTNMVVSYIAVDNGIRVPEDIPTLNKVGVVCVY